MDYRVYSVSPRDKEPLLSFVLEALAREGCKIIRHSGPSEAPSRVSFVTPSGERLGVICYAFLANAKATKNRPADEHRFQIKYGTKDNRLHRIWQDPYGLYTTLFVGINPEARLFVGADPAMHSPTRFFISLEFKEAQVQRILTAGWHAWERDRRGDDNDPVEVLVGGTSSSFLRYVYFERAAQGLDQGHRHLLAEKAFLAAAGASVKATVPAMPTPPAAAVHALARELELSEQEILDLIGSARMLKMAVRGWVAEEHLVRTLTTINGVSECSRLDEDGGPDVSLRYNGSKPLTIQCKNVLRQRAADGTPRLDFQKTRAAKADPCSRYYKPGEFDLVAACLHAITEQWQFRFALPWTLDPHRKCEGRLASTVRVDERWTARAESALAEASAR